VKVNIKGLEYLARIPKGNKRATSTSKIKKRIVTIKNRSEKGARAFLLGLKPHSKGVSFSRSVSDFLPKVSAIVAKATATTNEIIIIDKIRGMVKNPISRWRYTEKVRLRLQSVNIK